MAKAAVKSIAQEAVADKPLYADTEEVKAFAESLSQSFLECRELGHNWKPFHGQYLEADLILRILRCPRCKTERHQEISMRGVVMRNFYKHPDGYLHEGMGRIVGEGRDALRVESLARFMTKVGEAAPTTTKRKKSA